MKTNKEFLQYHIEHMSPEQIDYMANLIRTFAHGNISKGKLIEFTVNEAYKRGEIDTGLPLEVLNKMKEVHPGFNKFYHVYDFREPHKFGKLTNLAEELVDQMHNILMKY